MLNMIQWSSLFKPQTFDLIDIPIDTDDAKYDSDTAEHRASMIL